MDNDTVVIFGTGATKACDELLTDALPIDTHPVGKRYTAHFDSWKTGMWMVLKGSWEVIIIEITHINKLSKCNYSW